MKPQAATLSVFARQICRLSAYATQVNEIPVQQVTTVKVTRHPPFLAEWGVAT